MNGNSLGGSSKWVTPKGDRFIYPRRKYTCYTINFNSDCPKNQVTLNIASTGFLFIYLNGQMIKRWGPPWPVRHNLTLSRPILKCGCNTLRVCVYNYYIPSPSAIIYTLAQNLTGCFNCNSSALTFYNQKTCECDCISKSKCENR